MAVLAPTVLVRSRFIADVAAGTAVILVPINVRACSITANGPAFAMRFAAAIVTRGVLVGASAAAFVKAGSAIPGVVREIRASITSRTGPAEKLRVRVALAALGEALRLLALVFALAEVDTRIAFFGSPSCSQTQGAEESAGENGPKSP